MPFRVLFLLMILGASALLRGESAAPAPSTDGERVGAEEALGIVLSLPVVRLPAEHANGCDRIVADIQTLRDLLDIDGCDDDDVRKNTNGLALAAIQGLYEQIQARDKIMLQLDEQNRILHRQLTALETQRREDQTRIGRLESRMETLVGNFERQVGSTPLTGPDMQNSQLAQRLASAEANRREAESRLSRIESRLDTSFSRIDNRTRDLQSRLSRLESRVQSLPRQ